MASHAAQSSLQMPREANVTTLASSSSESSESSLSSFCFFCVGKGFCSPSLSVSDILFYSSAFFMRTEEKEELRKREKMVPSLLLSFLLLCVRIL